MGKYSLGEPVILASMYMNGQSSNFYKTLGNIYRSVLPLVDHLNQTGPTNDQL